MSDDNLKSPLLPFALLGEGANVRAPVCCGKSMRKSGECGDGCCSDYTCHVCMADVRVEWPD